MVFLVYLPCSFTPYVKLNSIYLEKELVGLYKYPHQETKKRTQKEETMSKLEDTNTTNIVLAALLKLDGYRMVKITKEGNRGTFHFEHVPQQELDDFLLGNALVEPTSFNNEIRSLTAVIKNTPETK